MRRGPRLLHGGCVVTVLLAGPVYRKNVGGVSGGRRGSERVSRKPMEHGPKDESGRHSPLLCHWGFPLDRCPGGYRAAIQVGCSPLGGSDFPQQAARQDPHRSPAGARHTSPAYARPTFLLPECRTVSYTHLTLPTNRE